MFKYSEWIRKEFSLDNFELTGDPFKDGDRYIESQGIHLAKTPINKGILATAVLRVSFGKTFSIHILTDGVVEKIKHVRIENIPTEIPRFMQNSFLIEARHDKPLLDNIIAIGGFVVKNEMYILFTTDNKETYTQIFSKTFDGRNLNELNIEYNKDIYPIEKLTYMKNRKDVFAFALVFALMLEADKTPLVIEVKSGKKQKKIKKSKEKAGWIEKRIYIDRTIKYKNIRKGNGTLNKDGKHLKDTLVHGFLRLQRFGKELSKSKWIYIDNYPSRRWTNTGDTKTIVDIYDK